MLFFSLVFTAILLLSFYYFLSPNQCTANSHKVPRSWEVQSSTFPFLPKSLNQFSRFTFSSGTIFACPFFRLLRVPNSFWPSSHSHSLHTLSFYFLLFEALCVVCQRVGRGTSFSIVLFLSKISPFSKMFSEAKNVRR